MPNQYPFKGAQPYVIIFFLSIVTGFYWLTASWFAYQKQNIYDHRFIGAAFEILWLPVMIMTFLLPILSIIYWWKRKSKSSPLYLLSIFIIGAVVFIKFISTRM